MARTRKSDPGRDQPLHYAATPGQRHAKRQVYASLTALALSAAVGVIGTASAFAQDLPDGTGVRGTAAVPCVACQGLSLSPAQTSWLPDALAGARILLRIPAGTAASGWADSLESLRRRGATAGIHVIGVPADADPLLDADIGTLVIEPLDSLTLARDRPGAGDADRLAFDLKQALSLARGRHPSATLLIAAPPDVAAALHDRGLDPYVDGVLPVPAAIRRAEDLVTLGPALRLWRLTENEADARAIAAAAAALQAWLPAGLVPVTGRMLQCGEDRPLRPLLNPQTLDLVAVSRTCPSPAMVTSDVPGATAERFDLGETSVFRVRVNAGDRFAEGVDVSAARALTVDEIIARHQAAAARQAAEIATSIARGSLTLTFEAPGFVAPITITSQTTIYEDRRRADAAQVELQQHDIRVNGVPFGAGGGVPRLPIIEPERAAAPPLAITLSNVYRYRLNGRETIAGRDCYVVSFEPRDRRAALFAGRAWIDGATFGMVRVAAAQSGLKGPITASEQDDEFVLEDGRWRLARSNVRQTYEGASVRTPIHRLLAIDRDEVNAADFDPRRAAAYASDDVMLRDTPEGYRYLKRDAVSRQPEAGSAQPDTRVLAGRADRIRTLAFGVIVDPNISVPLPFAGLSYVDFNLFGTGTQFSGFFGGSFGQLALSVPSLGGTRWQLAGRAFGIASSYNDRAFEQGHELYALDIRQRPAQAAVWLLRPISPRSALRLEYDWDYTKFGEGEQTDRAFLVPRSQNAHALRIGLDVQRAGWQGSAWVSHAQRVGWQEWGLPASGYRAEHADYQRYGASLLRSQAISPRVTTRIEAAVMGGRDLDRFSRFAFGTFDNRLRGYPAALVRYDHGAVLRTAVAWTAARWLRLDGFADTAEVHDPGFGPGLRNYTGFGAAIEAPAPFGTLVAVEWGFGVQGVRSSGGRGTHVVRISGYKVF